jgi:PAS domain S-box-containing protein
MSKTPDTQPPQRVSEQGQRLKRLALVAERSSNAVVLADAERRIEWVNDAFLSITGFTLHESIGQRLGILLERGSADPEAFEQFSLAVQQGRGFKREINIRAMNGEARFALVDLQPTHDDTGVSTGWVLIAPT